MPPPGEEVDVFSVDEDTHANRVALLSQHSSYSQLSDIDEMILQAPIGTQLMRSLNSTVNVGHRRVDSGISEPPPSSESVQSKSSNNENTLVDGVLALLKSSTVLFSRVDSNCTSGSSVSAGASTKSPISRTDRNTSTGSSASTNIKSNNVAQTPVLKVLGKRKTQGRPFKSARLVSPDEDDAFSPVIISHSPSHQRLFHSLELPYGATTALNKTELQKLQGLNNAQAVPRIRALFGKTTDSVVDEAFAKEIAAKAPWVELDLEDKNLREDPLAGLGLRNGASDWFGGKVHFVGKLVADSKNKECPFKVVLKTPELGPSDRFARRWGSGRFLTISLSKELLKKGEQIIEFFHRPLILGDHVFRAFDAKDGNVFLVCTNEIVEARRIHATRTAPGLLSLRNFLSWHNSLELDLNQTMAKWASRFALGRSNSAPVLRLEEDAITQIPDLTSGAGSDMTDGAGLINKAGLRLIYNRIEMDTWPTAIQCRVGLLVMHPNDIDDRPRIWLRPSQIKVKHTSLEDPTLRTIDLLRSSHAKTQCRLPVETIINLAENGVPSSSFIKLIEDALVRLVTPLITWNGPEAMEKLWCAVASSGGVMSSRLARQNTVLARVKGYSERDSGEIDNEDEEENNDQPVSTAWWVDQISGCPSSLEETCLHLLDSGFTPQTCSVLRSKLDKVVKGCVDRYIESYRIDLPVGMSAMAFLVPDEYGVLEAGEFFFKSSRHVLQTQDGLPTDILLGDALITRHPCKLPTDVQKWTAVDRPELRHFTDVIVLSVKGPRRAADFLSGGDYDGDKGLLVWQPELVEPFVNAPVNYSEEPAHVADSFSPKNETVRDFLQRTGTQTPAKQLREMQKYLLSALRDISVVGKYSNWHINATYSLGYRHPETIRLAYMFCKTLDGAKTGLTVLPRVFKNDQTAYEKRPPVWKEAEKKKGQSTVADWKESNMPNLARGEGLGRFIMDTIHKHTQRERWGLRWGQELKAQIKSKFEGVEHVLDVDLTAPWLAFVEKEAAKKEASERHRAEISLLATHTLNTPGLAEADKAVAVRLLEEAQTNTGSDLERIQKHVESVYAAHKSKIDGKFTKLQIERRQDILRELSRDFATGPPGLSMDAEEAARIKASYAYFFDWDKRQNWSIKWSRFPWDVAFRELCLIKTRASKATTLKPVNSEFYERFTMKMPRI
ncbi:RNA dependent RNA polymerase-domain-containing protein [Mycena galericulata]|nr:RNA dependent RNA polymerase-domain-containing protein [Mycena galericulata]